MNAPLPNQIIREITPLSDKDCFYIAERYPLSTNGRAEIDEFQ